MEQPGTAASRVSGSMFSWVSKDARRKKEPELFQTVAEGLRQLYAQKLLPLEEHYRFHEFHSPALEDADFDNKPMVLLVGQYSTGKTTFIRHLIEQDLFKDIQSLPRNAALRKLNDLIKRARLAKVHAYIISSLKKEMPNVFGKESKKKELVNNLGEIYAKIEREHQISAGDFPSLRKMQELLQTQDFSKFQALKPKLLDTVDDMLANDIARLMVMVRQEESLMPSQAVKGGAFDGTMNGPFGHGYGEGAGEGIDDIEWVVGKDKPTYDEIFYTLSPVNGKITGANAKKEMVKSKLPNTVLGKIWKLADVDKDGLLDDEEFALANHLIKVKLEGHELPTDLPPHLIPPSKRRLE
uniref:EH domain-containing protein 1 n=1 Tax=Rousettus aegyptiacus TaxID=9407 RepID=A0A7J8GYI8_ROUAE|nr:EH domain containing 1 [Rousettus aegyptiacus]